MGYEESVQHVAGEHKGDIFLFAISTCVWCKKTKKLLGELGMDYRFVDVDLLEGERRAAAMHDVSVCNESLSFPTIRVNGNRCILGFKEDEIRGLADLEQ